MTFAAISWTFGLEDLESLFEKVQALGFSAIQYCGDFEKHSAQEVLQMSEKYQIEIVGYDPFNCKPKNPKDSTLEKSVAFYKKVIDYTVELECGMATLQGLSFWTGNQDSYEKSVQQVISAVAMLDEYASEKGILLTYEACNHYETPCLHTYAELVRVIKDSKAKQVKVVLDTFHMNINEPNPEETLRNMDPDLFYSYHVSDSGRGGIGTGHVDFKKQHEILKEKGFDGLVCFEVVAPECRPDKFPMNQSQMELFSKQVADSLSKWKSF